MNEINAQLARIAERFNLAIGIVIAVSASLAGAVLVGGPLGGIVGLLAGSAVALALCGAIAMMASILAMARDEVARPAAGRAAGPVAATMAPAAQIAVPAGSAALAVAAAGEGALNGHAAHAPQAAGAESVITESEAQLLNAGKFSAYHLAKAKRMLAEGNVKEAAYQAGASLAHDAGNTEALALRKQALGR